METLKANMFPHEQMNGTEPVSDFIGVLNQVPLLEGHRYI